MTENNELENLTPLMKDLSYLITKVNDIGKTLNKKSYIKFDFNDTGTLTDIYIFLDQNDINTFSIINYDSVSKMILDVIEFVRKIESLEFINDYDNK